MIDLSSVNDFLGCRTPEKWCVKAVQNLDLLLIDHAHCEKKAASTALSLMYRYVDQYELLQKLSRLAREELRHFEQVLKILKSRNIDYRHLPPARYAGGLRTIIRNKEPDKLIDTLIMGAFIEARSCERFESLIPYLDEELQQFYTSLLKSESRHFAEYLMFAEKIAGNDVSVRVDAFRRIEQDLILTPDEEFHFHSGVPN